MHFRPNSQDEAVFREVYTQNCYRLPDDMTGLTVLDLGAHIGSFARACIDRGATVICVEPDPDNFALLIENVPEANCYHMAVAATSAIADGCVKFAPADKNGYLLSACGSVNEKGKLAVDAITLDGLLRQYGGFDLLKLDIEGAEFDVLPESHELHRVQNIVLEAHDHLHGNHDELAAVLRKQGFQVQSRRDEFWQCPELWNMWASRGEPLCQVGKLKLDVLVCQFSYGGNGGTQSEHPDVGRYLMKVALAAKGDERIGRFRVIELADTPITMARNKAVVVAKQQGFDCILMIDSDMQPDCELADDPSAKPFFPTAFDYLYQHYEKGPVCIGAPYCGPPPVSNMYVFHWSNWSNANQSQGFNGRIEQYSRNHAEMMSGIAPCAALPTGLILFDTRLFDICPPGKGRGWFYYEWTDDTASQKASTEDVTATRDLSFMGQLKLGYNPVLCAWDCWAGHHKALCVRKPRTISVDYVNEVFADAVRANRQSTDRIMAVDYTEEVHA